jgi:hypothetical protein
MQSSIKPVCGVLFVAFAAIGTPSWAEGTPEPEIQRNINSQPRIENGIRDGSPNTAHEATGLERGQAAPPSQRMPTDVQRHTNQQTRIHNGIQSGRLTNREPGTLERGPSYISRAEARAGVDGASGRREPSWVQRQENLQSARTTTQKSDPKKQDAKKPDALKLDTPKQDMPRR